MLEDSVENFILQWKNYAATVSIYPNIEGSPLLECFANDKVFYLFERTNPYESTLGTKQVIIHPVAAHLELINTTKKEINTIGLSQLQAKGLIIYRSQYMAVVDVGLPLVVGSFEILPDEIVSGEWVELVSLSPIHGFVVPASQGEMSFAGADEI